MFSLHAVAIRPLPIGYRPPATLHFAANSRVTPWHSSSNVHERTTFSSRKWPGDLRPATFACRSAHSASAPLGQRRLRALRGSRGGWHPHPAADPWSSSARQLPVAFRQPPERTQRGALRSSHGQSSSASPVHQGGQRKARHKHRRPRHGYCMLLPIELPFEPKTVSTRPRTLLRLRRTSEAGHPKVTPLSNTSDTDCRIGPAAQTAAASNLAPETILTLDIQTESGHVDTASCHHNFWRAKESSATGRSGSARGLSGENIHT